VKVAETAYKILKAEHKLNAELEASLKKGPTTKTSLKGSVKAEPLTTSEKPKGES